MTKITSGAKNVKKLEQAMGGTPPASALQASRAALQRITAERLRSYGKARDEAAKLAEPMRKAIFSHLDKDDPTIARNRAATKALFERRSKRTIQSPKLEKFEPHFSVGSNLWLKVPPYDDAWTFGAASNTVATADKASGQCSLAAQSFGDGTLEVAAGVMVWFLAPADDPQQRFAALMDYSYDWWDSAAGYVAHNNFTTRLWVWGATEQRWVGQADVSPSWSDGVGWWEDHSGEDGGRIAVQTYLPVRANQWYAGWVWFDAIPYADSGFFGSAFSSIHFNATVPFVIFGSL